MHGCGFEDVFWLVTSEMQYLCSLFKCGLITLTCIETCRPADVQPAAQLYAKKVLEAALSP